MKLGLALSGGALRGAAHIGVLKALAEHDIKPDLIAGTSSGSLIAALYATGMSAEEMIKLTPEINASLIDINFWGIFKYLTRFSKEFTGFIKGNRFLSYMQEKTKGKNFSETNIPLLMVATDIESGCKIIYASEKLDIKERERKWMLQMPVTENIAKAVRASCSIPVVLNSVKSHGYNLVDGGIRNNVPVELLKKLGADKVIAVNLGFTGQRGNINDPWDYLMQTIDIMGNEVSKEQLEEADYVIRPKIYDISTLDFSKINESIERGYNATKKEIDQIKESLHA